MNKLVFVISLFIFFSCQEKKQSIPTKVEVTQGISAIYTLEKNQGECIWVIEKLGKKQAFSIPVSSGRISVLDGVIATGDVELDIVGLKAKDLKSEAALLFETTLRDTSFFGATNFPVGRIIISKIEKIAENPNATHQLSLDITLKNVTKTLQIPAQIQLNDTEIILNSTIFSLPLLEWNIKPKDKIVCTMQFSLKANKELVTK